MKLHCSVCTVESACKIFGNSCTCGIYIDTHLLYIKVFPIFINLKILNKIFDMNDNNNNIKNNNKNNDD